MRVTIKGERGLRDLARDLRRAKGTVRRELADSLRKPTAAGVRDAKASIAGLSIRGQRTRSRDRFTAPTTGGHIRARIARVIEADVSTSAGNPRAVIVVRNERLGNARNVPWLLDTGKTYRHPIMGNRSAWAGSRGSPWFYSAIDQEAYVREADEALTRIVQKIERG